MRERRKEVESAMKKIATRQTLLYSLTVVFAALAVFFGVSWQRAARDRDYYRYTCGGKEFLDGFSRLGLFELRQGVWNGEYPMEDFWQCREYIDGILNSILTWEAPLSPLPGYSQTIYDGSSLPSEEEAFFVHWALLDSLAFQRLWDNAQKDSSFRKDSSLVFPKGSREAGILEALSCHFRAYDRCWQSARKKTTEWFGSDSHPKWTERLLTQLISELSTLREEKEFQESSSILRDYVRDYL